MVSAAGRVLPDVIDRFVDKLRVRVLCSSIMENDGIMAGDKQIRLKPDASVLGYEAGDEIRLSEADFRLLSEAFLAEIEAKYR